MKFYSLLFGCIVIAAAAFVYAARRPSTASINDGADINASAAVADSAGAVASGGSGAKTVPVIVELFTSEGCSSCPPADALLSRLDRTQPVAGVEIIPLAMHVDYWNYLGWSDPFSSHEFSERQGQYSEAYGKDGVYTPQMIVDGVTEFPGGNSGRAADAIAKAAREAKAEIQITRATEQPATGLRLALNIKNLPKGTDGGDAYVLLAVTESGLASDVSRGENAGQKLTHVGVVRSLTTVGSLADARGGAFNAEPVIALAKNWRRENLRVVVFAQERGSRRILAAASYKVGA
ncbi:MAG: DUF1223 domain-containing protein [Pyrinomonadaceae bacterium]